MPRYDRNDYRMDWRRTKSDILRAQKSIAHKRRIMLVDVVGIITVLVLMAVTLKACIWG